MASVVVSGIPANVDKEELEELSLSLRNIVQDSIKEFRLAGIKRFTVSYGRRPADNLPADQKLIIVRGEFLFPELKTMLGSLRKELDDEFAKLMTVGFPGCTTYTLIGTGKKSEIAAGS